MHVHALCVVIQPDHFKFASHDPVKIGVLARDKIKLVKAWGRGNLTLMSLPNFHLEMPIKSLAVMHLTYNFELSRTALCLYNEIIKPTTSICTCKVNNINRRLSCRLLTTIGPSSTPVYTTTH